MEVVVRTNTSTATMSSSGITGISATHSLTHSLTHGTEPFLSSCTIVGFSRRAQLHE
jgi:hypothetical protein